MNTQVYETMVLHIPHVNEKEAQKESIIDLFVSSRHTNRETPNSKEDNTLSLRPFAFLPVHRDIHH